MSDKFVVDWDTIIREAPSIARRIARDYPGIETSDIEQEMFLHCLENLKTLERTTKSVFGLRKVMHTAGTKYAANERYSYIGHSTEWIYTPAEVRALFEAAFFDDDLWDRVPEKDDGFKINAKNVVVSLWDLQNAFEKVSVDDQFAICERYDLGITYDASHADYDRKKKALQRAIDRVTMRLNGDMAANSDITTIDIYDSEDI